ncbi:MAG: type II toxin-antitoxin system RelE/ParE family toxin [Desulfobulbaceae bacterium]|nr:type II toxin-antitoxin system RelE/ParE family toxin [Desulfobulbaceae bacterium]MDH3922644.1 type II toxin-antitoxin system RelE/ParE family toxin [Desulfobulbaceae bacterium]
MSIVPLFHCGTPLEDDEYKSLQIALLLRPEQGSIIPGSGGLRKVRWARKRMGKRGGIRLIYYWDKKTESFYMLLIYSKSKKDDLSQDQLRILNQLIKEELK